MDERLPMLGRKDPIMKKLLLITILILSCQILASQIKTDYELLTYNFNPIEIEKKGIPESIKIIGIIAGSVILEAIGDAKYDDGKKEIGKLYQAVSVGILVASPFILDIDQSKWGWYFASYVSFRIALFDPIYNLTRGLPMGYIGSTSFWDKGVNYFNPPEGMKVFGHSIFLIVAISIPINHF